MEIGDAVRYIDAHGKQHAAIVTQVWSQAAPTQASINLVYVSGDDSETDQYGRQIKRKTSIVHKDDQGAPGNYWE